MQHIEVKIDRERNFYRKAIDEEIKIKSEGCAECTQIPEKPPIDLMAIDHGMTFKFYPTHCKDYTEYIFAESIRHTYFGLHFILK